MALLRAAKLSKSSPSPSANEDSLPPFLESFLTPLPGLISSSGDMETLNKTVWC